LLWLLLQLLLVGCVIMNIFSLFVAAWKRAVSIELIAADRTVTSVFAFQSSTLDRFNDLVDMYMCTFTHPHPSRSRISAP